MTSSLFSLRVMSPASDCCRMSLPSSALSPLKTKKAGKKLKTKVKEGTGLSTDKGIIGQMY